MNEFILLCEQCGEQVEVTYNHCRNCGNAIDLNTDKGYTLYCLSCSKDLPKGSRMCSTCGNVFSWNNHISGNPTNNQGSVNFTVNPTTYSTGFTQTRNRSSFWIIFEKLITTLSFLIIVAVCTFGGVIMSESQDDYIFILYGGIIGVVIGLSHIALMMIFLNMAQDIRDIANQVCR